MMSGTMEPMPPAAVTAAAGAVRALLRLEDGNEAALVDRVAGVALGLAESFCGQLLIERMVEDRVAGSVARQPLSATPVRAILSGARGDRSRWPWLGPHARGTDGALPRGAGGGLGGAAAGDCARRRDHGRASVRQSRCRRRAARSGRRLVAAVAADAARYAEAGMTAREALRGGLLTGLRSALPPLGVTVFDALPVRASVPQAVLGEPSDSDWGRRGLRGANCASPSP